MTSKALRPAVHILNFITFPKRKYRGNTTSTQYIESFTTNYSLHHNIQVFYEHVTEKKEKEKCEIASFWKLLGEKTNITFLTHNNSELLNQTFETSFFSSFF